MLRSLTLLFIVFTASQLNAQGIEGNWKINHLITDSLTLEYTLTPLSEDPWKNYGNIISVTDSNYFHSYYTAPCGNDCFVSSIGKFHLVGSDHIQFVIESVTYTKECDGQTAKDVFPLDIGLYYIDRRNGQINLVKNKGNIYQDKKNVSYADSIDRNFEESKTYTNLLEWIKPRNELPNNPNAVASYYFSKIQDKPFEVLYSKMVDYKMTVILLKVKKQLNYLFYYSSNADSSEKKNVYTMALYDKQLVQQIGTKVKGLNNKRAKFKVQTLASTDTSLNQETTIYTQKKELKIMVVKNLYPDYKSTTITEYYFEKEKPIYLKISYVNNSEEKEHTSCKEFYVTGINQFISKELIRQTFEVNSSHFYKSLENLERLKKEFTGTNPKEFLENENMALSALFYG